MNEFLCLLLLSSLSLPPPTHKRVYHCYEQSFTVGVRSVPKLPRARLSLLEGVDAAGTLATAAFNTSQWSGLSDVNTISSGPQAVQQGDTGDGGGEGVKQAVRCGKPPETCIHRYCIKVIPVPPPRAMAPRHDIRRACGGSAESNAR